MKRWLSIALLLAVVPVFAGDDGAVIAALTGARRMMPTTEGFQIVSQKGMWMRAVRTVDGGYCIFSTNGSSRIFPTPMGFGFQGVSNDIRSVTMTQRGFVINSAEGSVNLVKAGSAWIDRDSTNNYRVILGGEGFSVVSGPLAPMPADAAYELFIQRDSEKTPERQFTQPAPDPTQHQVQPVKIRTSFDTGR